MNSTLKAPSPTDEQRAGHQQNIAAGIYSRQDLIRTQLWPIKYTHAQIHTVRDLKETLRAGKYAWPGGYPLYFITADSEPLSFEAALQEFRQIVECMSSPHAGPCWRIVGCEVNYEQLALYCSHTGNLIESAYGEDE